MTKEEIINTPKLVDFMLDESVIADSREKLRKRLKEVCNLAIKALEQEPCDCIRRKQLVRELNAQVAVNAITKETAQDMLDHLPSIQPKPKTDVLDKIRAEIIEDCGYSKDYVGAFDYSTINLKLVLQIIDKYKAESEG